MLAHNSFTFARLFVFGWSRNIVVKEQVPSPHRFAVGQRDKVPMSLCSPLALLYMANNRSRGVRTKHLLSGVMDDWR